MCVCFFFSSRRRHTRCYRDWSSDVCSSDLHVVGMRCRDMFSVLCGADIFVFRFGRLSSRPSEFTGQESPGNRQARKDRKSTRLNSSHGSISYAVFCLKKKKRKEKNDKT